MKINRAILAFVSFACLLRAGDKPAPAPIPTQADDYMATWLAPAEPLHIVGPIHFVGTKGLGVYLITTPAGHILLGGGMPPSTALIEDSIRKLGFKLEDIKFLLSNHAHGDHVGTLAELKKHTGGAVAAMLRDVDLLASGGKLDYVFAKVPRLHYPPVTTDRALQDGDIIELGGVKITAHLTAGHTRGSTTYTTTVQDTGLTFSVVFPDGTGINPGTRLVNDPSYPGILEDYRATIRTLEALKPDIFLTYHTDEYRLPEKRARAATEGATAFVDPDGYARFIAARRAKLEQLVAQEKAAPAPGAAAGKIPDTPPVK